MRNRPLGIKYMKREKPNISISFPASKKVKTVDSQVLEMTETYQLAIAPPSKLFVSNAGSAFTGIQIAYISWRSKNFNK
jgi:hypothetical protein